jgi:hypothetical protein
MSFSGIIIAVIKILITILGQRYSLNDAGFVSARQNYWYEIVFRKKLRMILNTGRVVGAR